MRKIIRNAIQCNNCGEIIASKHRHDYVQCKCGACAVDGRHDYLRRCYMHDGDGFTDLSETIEISSTKATGGNDENT